MIKLTDYKLPQPLFYLYLNRIIILIGVGFWALFLPIFLFERFNNSYLAVIIFFLIMFFITIFLQPLGAMAMSKIGLRKSMVIAVCFLVCYYLSFYLFDLTASFYFLIIAILVGNFWRMMYWIPFHVDFAKFSTKKDRGKQYSIYILISDILGIIIPVLAGLIIFYAGYSVMFIVAMVIILSSVSVIYRIKRSHEDFSFTYLQTYHILFKKNNRKMLLAYMADGAETIIGAIIWPIFIFQILQGQYLAVGAVSTLIIGITVILDVITGRLTDKFSKKKIVGYSSVFYAIGWLLKIFVVTATHIFIISTYHNLANIFRRVPFDALMYEKAADHGHYVDEYTVLREIALNIGRVLMLVAVAVLIQAFDIYVAFLLAAVVSVFINVLE